MKRKKVILNRFTVALLAILCCFAMLFGAVFNSFKDYAEFKAAYAVEGEGESEGEDGEYKYELTSVTVTPKEGWIFSSNTPVTSLYKMVTVTVTYDDISLEIPVEGKYELEFTGETDKEGNYVAVTGETVKFEISIKESQATVKVEVVSLKADAGFSKDEEGNVIKGEASTEPIDTVDTRTQNGIYAEFKKKDSEGKDIVIPPVNSGTNITLSSLRNVVAVFAAYDDGSVDDQDLNLPGRTDYVLDGNFFPESFYNEKERREYRAEDTYDKEIIVKENKADGFSTTLVWKDVEFVAPVSMGTAIEGTLARQYARSSSLNFEGLTIKLTYGTSIFDQVTLTVPLSAFEGEEFSEAFGITYYSDPNSPSGEIKGDLTTAVHSIYIIFTYPGALTGAVNNAQGFYIDVTVDPLPIHAPAIPKIEGSLAWNEGASIQLGNWDYPELYEKDPPVVRITAVNADNENDKDKLIEVKDIHGNPISDTANPENGIAAIHFLKAGVKYQVTITLVDAKTEKEGGDFTWSASTIPLDYVRNPGIYVLQFEIQVSKGVLDLQLSELIKSEYKILNEGDWLVYGQQNENGTVTPSIYNTDKALTGKTWKLVDANEDTTNKDQSTWYYHLLYFKNQTDANNYYGAYQSWQKAYDETKDDDNKFTASPSNNMTFENTSGATWKTDRPKDAGTYSVIAVMHENDGYFTAVSAPVTLEIKQFKINTEATSKTFDREKYWTLNDFLTINNSFPYGETAFTILTIKDSGGSPIGASTKFHYADKYTAMVSLLDDTAKNNYTLDGKDKVEFSITTYTDSAFTFTASGWSYGTEGANPKINVSYVDSSAQPYYPSKTGNLANDFRVEFFVYDESAENHEGENLTYDKDDPNATYNPGNYQFNAWQAGRYYLIKLTAKADPNDTNEKAAVDAGTTVSYTLPVVYSEKFYISASPIDMPYLDKDATEWVLSGKDAVAKIVKDYQDGKSFTFDFEQWTVGDNLMPDGTTPIIKVLISYVSPTNINYSLSDCTTKSFSITNAGTYTITITLNANYSWDEKTVPEGYGLNPNDPEYSFIGIIARQKITLLQDTNITGDKDTYDGSLQLKSISGWNDRAMAINSVYVTDSTLTGGIVTPSSPDSGLKGNEFKVTNAGKYTIRVSLSDEENYEWDDPTASGNQLTNIRAISYTLEKAVLKVKWDVGFEGTTNKDAKDEKGNYLYPRYEFDGTHADQTIPTPTAIVCGEDEISIAGYDLFKEGSSPFTDKLDGDVTAIGFYYILATSFSGTLAENYRLPDPEKPGELIIWKGTIFEIYAQTLKTPEYKEDVPLGGKTIDETYKGKTFDLTEYIYEYKNRYVFQETAVIKFTIQKDGKTVENVQAAGTYEVLISIIGDNFTFEGGVKQCSFTVEVAQLMVEIDWNGKLTITYGETPDIEPYEITNIQSNDENKLDALSLIIRYKKDNNDVDISTANAGEYTIYAYELNGTHKDNYKIVEGTGANTSNSSEKFTILKRQVIKPRLPSGTQDFNGVSGNRTISGNKDNPEAAKITVEARGVLPKAWFTTALADDSIRTLAPITVEFNANESGTFTYKRAAIYTFEVFISATNYYWVNEDGTTLEGGGDADDFAVTSGTYSYKVGKVDAAGEPVENDKQWFLVERVQLIAPNIKNQRTQEWDKEEKEGGKGTLEITNFGEAKLKEGSSGAVPKYDILYGKRADDGQGDAKTDTAWLGYDMSDGAVYPNEGRQGEQGIYYALLTIDTREFQDNYDLLLNYVWVAHPEDRNELGDNTYLFNNVDVFTYAYSASGSTISIKIFYAITKGQLDLWLEVNEYEYGENGYINGVEGTAKFTLGVGSRMTTDASGVIYLTGDDLALQAIGSVGNEPTIQKLTFWKGTDPENAENIITADSSAAINPMLNGLPWEPGIYTVGIELQFGNGETYANLPLYVSFTVKPRTITSDMLVWSGDEYTYDHDYHLATAQLKNVIKQEAGEVSDIDLTGITLTVKWDGNDDYRPINVGEYTMKVAGIGSNIYFRLPTEEQEKDDAKYVLTHTLTITPKDVTVRGVDVTDHVYGDAIQPGEKSYENWATNTEDENAKSQKGFYTEVPAAAIKVTILQSGTNAEATSLSPITTPENTYYIKVEWVDSDSQHAKNYNVTFKNDAVFTIVAREVTIQWAKDNTNPTKVYGEEKDLYELLDAIACNSKDQNKNNFLLTYTLKDIVTLVAKLDNEAQSFNKYAPAGAYTIEPSVNSEFEDQANWKISFAESESWTFTVEKATIKEDGTSFDLRDEDKEKEGPQLLYIAVEQDIFVTDFKIVLVNDDTVSGNRGSSVWKYAKVDNASAKPGEVAEKDWKPLDKTNANIQVRNAGHYIFLIWIQVDNHHDFTKTVEIDVEKQTLTISFSFEIMYGEDNPAEHENGYQFGQESLRAGTLTNGSYNRAAGNHWTVSGLVDSNETSLFYTTDGEGKNPDFYGLTGDFTYTIPTFPVWTWEDVQYNQALTIDFNGTPTCINYDIKWGTSTLTVKPIPITVKALSLNNFLYNASKEEETRFPAYKGENGLNFYEKDGVAYEVTYPASSYDPATKHTTPDEKKAGLYSLIGVKTDAFDKLRPNSTTAEVGTHEITIETLTTFLYKFTPASGDQDAAVTIIAAELEEHNVTGYSAQYDEKYHGLTVNNVQTVENPDDGNTPWKWVDSGFKAASDGTPVTVEFWLLDSNPAEIPLNDYRLDVTWASYKLGEGQYPAYIDCGTYYIVYRISADNYIKQYGSSQIVITIANNTLKNDFGFEGTDANDSIYSSTAEGPELGKVEDKYAWIYGYGAKNSKGEIDGFDATGKHVIKEPVATFHRADKENQDVKLQYKLTYYATKTSKGEVISNDTGYDSVDTLFKAMFAIPQFNAGFYQLAVSMDLDEIDSPNFSFTTVKYYFQVAKRAVTVSVAEEEIRYGENAPAYTLTGEDNFVSNGPSALKDTFATAIQGGTPKFAANDYAPGSNVNKKPNPGYTVSIQNKGDLSSQNYIVTYDDSALYVKEREVTIKIHSFIDTVYGDTVSTDMLTFEVVSGSPFDIYKDQLKGGPTDGKYNNTNQTLLKLHTKAITADGKTNDVRWKNDDVTHNTPSNIIPYAIYVVFNTTDSEDTVDTKNANNATNYSVTFEFGSDQSMHAGGTDNADEVVEGTGEPIGGSSSAPNAGTFLINRASATINVSAVYHFENGEPENPEEAPEDTKTYTEKGKATYYTGGKHYVDAYLSPSQDDTKTQLTKLTVKYTKGSETTQFMLDAGTYSLSVVAVSGNYYPSGSASEITIQKADLTVTATEATVEYGTYLSGNVKTDIDNGTVKSGGRFTGFTYSVVCASDNTNKYIHPDILSYYRENNDAKTIVTYSTGTYEVTTDAGSKNYKITPEVNKLEGDTWYDNITFTKVSGDLTIAKRNVTVTLVGWDEDNIGDAKLHNTAAWCFYTGTSAALTSEFKSKYENNYSLFLNTDVDDTFGALPTSEKYKNNWTALYEALGISLSIPTNKIDVGLYDVSCTPSDETNFNVTVVNKDATQFKVKPAEITIRAYSGEGVTAENAYSVVYGTKINTHINHGFTQADDFILRYSVVGLKGGQTLMSLLQKDAAETGFNFTITALGGAVYKEWDSGIGTYTVTINELTKEQLDLLYNYTVSYAPATLTITQRTISASLEKDELTFIPDPSNKSGGATGMGHEPTIQFTDSGKNDQVNTTHRAIFTPTYAVRGATSYGAAPKVVGDYTVKVTLAAEGNYTFDGGRKETTLDFKVIPLEISTLAWTPSRIEWDGVSHTTYDSYIEDYQKDYMQITRFLYITNGGASTELKEGTSAGELNTYYFDESGRLHIKLDTDNGITGTYMVNIQLKDTVGKNIRFVLGSDTADSIISQFIVSSQKVTMTITFEDFMYGSTPNAPTVVVDQKTILNAVLRYAAIKDTSTLGTLYEDSRTKQGLEYEDLTNLSYGQFSSITNFEVGYYLLSVFDPGSSATRYFVFQVTKRMIDAPSITVKGTEVKFNGGDLVVEVSYTATEVSPVFDAAGGTLTTSNNTAVFTVRNANTYYIQFVLVDSKNTDWNKNTLPTGVTVDQGDATKVTFTWTVAKDEATDNHADILSVPEMIDDKLYYGDIYDLANVSILKSGYGVSGDITLYYKLRGEGDVTPGTTLEEGWQSVWTKYNLSIDRLDANSYWLMAILHDTSNQNYSDKIAIGSFIIKPKELDVTISGTITYGESIYGENGVSNKFKPEVTGMLNDEEVSFQDYRYVLVEDYSGDYSTAGHLKAGGTYYIILTTNDAGNLGITVGDKGNYKLNPVQGVLTVLKRSVTVTFAGASGDYLVDPAKVLEDLEYQVDPSTPLAPDETKDVLEIVFETDAVRGSEVGGIYWITITDWDKSNYEISYQRASYTVNPLAVEIRLEAQSGTYQKGHKVVGATYQEDDITITNEDIDDEDKVLILEYLRQQIKLHYTGTSYEKGSYDSDEAPELAGNYTAQITGGGKNFLLTGLPSVDFTIQKQYVENSSLQIANQTYTGKALTPKPGVVDGVSDDILNLVKFTIVAYTDAGTYPITVALKDAYNYQWRSTQDDSITVSFTIDKADDALKGELTIEGWTYGNYNAEVNSPFAQVVSGSPFTFEYSTDGETFTNIIPDTGSVGTYYVRVHVAATENYNEYFSDPVLFKISKYLLSVPQIIQSDGTFTGEELTALINNYDARYMTVLTMSDARTFADDTLLTAVAVNAGTYNVYIGIIDYDNYGWQNEEGRDGVLTLIWSVAKKKVELPTAGKNSFVVNGNLITYLPEGFDESIMAIEGNAYSYGGDFVAVITLKDTANYEWADGSLKVELKWHITGSDILLIIIMSVLGLCILGGAVGIITQVALDKKQKRTEAEALAAIENKDTPDGEAPEGEAPQEGEADNADTASENVENEGGNE